MKRMSWILITICTLGIAACNTDNADNPTNSAPGPSIDSPENLPDMTTGMPTIELDTTGSDTATSR